MTAQTRSIGLVLIGLALIGLALIMLNAAASATVNQSAIAIVSTIPIVFATIIGFTIRR
jgi:hypothetical protein